MAELSQYQIESIAMTAAKTAVGETFRLLGIDVDDPLAVQRDMAHLRQWRKIFDGAVGKLMVVGLFGVLAIGVLWMGVEVTNIAHDQGKALTEYHSNSK